MASRISFKALREKVKQFILTSPGETQQDELIQHAILMADRELRECDLFPLAWDIVRYEGLQTAPFAYITAITQANPGVITADSRDAATTGHGYPDHSTVRSIVFITGIDGMEELNNRFFLLEYIDSTTFSLKTFDGLNDVDTSGYDEYSSSGGVYHAGLVLPTSAMLAGITQWAVKEIVPSPTFDGNPTNKIGRTAAEKAGFTTSELAGLPRHWAYEQFFTDSGDISHRLLWYPFASDEFNISIPYQKEVPDPEKWDDETYPLHPPQIHEYLWHGALAHLVGANERAKRGSKDEREFGQVEIMVANHWATQWARDKNETKSMSRRMLGHRGGKTGTIPA